jgi:hypothetical protein
MEYNKKQYLLLLSEIIAGQVIILGPDIAILKAKNIAGLVLNNKGNAQDVQGDIFVVLQKLVDGYVELTGQIAKNAIEPSFAEYPQIRKLINF